MQSIFAFKSKTLFEIISLILIIWYFYVIRFFQVLLFSKSSDFWLRIKFDIFRYFQLQTQIIWKVKYIEVCFMVKKIKYSIKLNIF